MASIGLSMIYAANKGTDGQVLTDATKGGVSDTGVYPIDTNTGRGNLGARTANITALEGTPVKISGNNEVVDVTNPPSSPSVALDFNAINPEVRETLLGKVSNGEGGWVRSDNPAEVALIIESQVPTTNKHVYYCFGRGHLAETNHNIGTNTDTAETRDDDTLTYTALGFEGFDGKPYAIYYEGSEGFNKQKMFDRVFPGQKLVTASADGTTDPSLHGGSAATSQGTSTSTTTHS